MLHGSPKKEKADFMSSLPEYFNGWLPKSFCDLKVIMLAVLQNKSLALA